MAAYRGRAGRLDRMRHQIRFGLDVDCRFHIPSGPLVWGTSPVGCLDFKNAGFIPWNGSLRSIGTPDGASKLGWTSGRDLLNIRIPCCSDHPSRQSRETARSGPRTLSLCPRADVPCRTELRRPRSHQRLASAGVQNRRIRGLRSWSNDPLPHAIHVHRCARCECRRRYRTPDARCMSLRASPWSSSRRCHGMDEEWSRRVRGVGSAIVAFDELPNPLLSSSRCPSDP